MFTHTHNGGPGDAIKTEAWALRRLVSIFAQVARRPHVPRDAQMRKLFVCIGIDVDRASNSQGPSYDNTFANVYSSFFAFFKCFVETLKH